MIADFFTKPLQGKLFCYLRDTVMGLEPFPMEERVDLYENSIKKLIVEECNSDSETPIKYQPSNDKKITWAEIVKNEKGKTKPLK